MVSPSASIAPSVSISAQVPWPGGGQIGRDCDALGACRVLSGGLAVVGQDLVACRMQAMDHRATHPAESNESDFHVCVSVSKNGRGVKHSESEAQRSKFFSGIGFGRNPFSEGTQAFSGSVGVPENAQGNPLAPRS
jgi:hypothetical protein